MLGSRVCDVAVEDVFVLNNEVGALDLDVPVLVTDLGSEQRNMFETVASEVRWATLSFFVASCLP